MSSQYTVDIHAERMDALPQRCFQDVSELPKTLQLGLKYTAAKKPYTYALVSVLGSGMGSFQMFSAITGSPIVGGILALCFYAGNIPMFLCPDFSEGIFLDMLLADKQHTEKIASAAKSNLIVSTVTFDFVFIPIVTYFLIIPLARDTEIFGPHTHIISPIMWTVTCLTLIPLALFEISANLSFEIGRVWKIKINDYLRTVRDILLEHNKHDPEANVLLSEADATDKLSVKHEEVEQWAREVNRKTANFNNGNLMFSFGFTLISLIMIASGAGGKNRTASIITLTALAFVMLQYGITNLFSIAKPSLAWETAKVTLLNDPRVQRGVVKLGWSERWENWLHRHELNAARAYGAKITMSAMRNLSSALASSFGIVMYFLLRNEFRQIAAI